MAAMAPQEGSPPRVAQCAPPGGTIEAACSESLTTSDLACKLAPQEVLAVPAPDVWEEPPVARRLPSPGRPHELRPLARAPRTPRPAALASPRARAHLVHTFLHHE